eukprot:97798-Prorocentrum_minimum.AAC.1
MPALPASAFGRQAAEATGANGGRRRARRGQVAGTPPQTSGCEVATLTIQAQVETLGQERNGCPARAVATSHPLVCGGTPATRPRCALRCPPLAPFVHRPMNSCTEGVNSCAKGVNSCTEGVNSCAKG